MILIQTLQPSQVHVVSDLADSIYPLELFEPQSVFESRVRLYPKGALVLTVDDTVAGYLFYHPWHEGQIVPIGTVLTALPNTSCAYLHDMAISPAYRNQGLGRRLACFVLDRVKSEGFNHCQCVSVLNSEGFWMKMGFTTTARMNYNGVEACKMQIAI